MKSDNNRITDYVIILGGGKGLRMGNDVPKQFLPVGDIPILMRTIRRFREYSSTLKIILVLPERRHEHWARLCEDYGFCENYEIANGGETRFHSIRNGLAHVPDNAEGVVAVHDGVRPFPSVEVIDRCFETARREGSAVPEHRLRCHATNTDWCRHHRLSTYNSINVHTGRITTMVLPMMLQWLSRSDMT